MRTKTNWIEARNIPEGEKVYLKKDFLGWRVVEPWKNEDGIINTFNLLLGGKRNLFMLAIILIIILLVFVGLKENIAQYKEIAKSPCNFCSTTIKDTKYSSLTNISFPIIDKPNG